MRETWKYTVDEMRDVWNCEHTLSYRCSKMRRLSVYQREGRCWHVENEMSPVNRDRLIQLGLTIQLKRIVRQPSVKPATPPAKMEPYISDSDYENINNIISMCGTTMEKRLEPIMQIPMKYFVIIYWQR